MLRYKILTATHRLKKETLLQATSYGIWRIVQFLYSSVALGYTSTNAPTRHDSTVLYVFFIFIFLIFYLFILTIMFYCNIEQKWSMQWNGRPQWLVSVVASSCQKCEKRNNRKVGHFLATQGQGPSMAQLDLLRALRQEGTPLVPRGQTTPYCCPTGHIDSGKGSAQMEDCVFQSVHRCNIWIYQEQVAHVSIRERTLDLFPIDTYTRLQHGQTVHQKAHSVKLLNEQC